MALICYECNLPRNKMAKPVQMTLTEERRVSKDIVYPIGAIITIGHICIKCARKAFAGGNGKSQHGQGWRSRFASLIESIKKSKKTQQTPISKSNPVATTVPKKSLIGRIFSKIRKASQRGS